MKAKSTAGKKPAKGTVGKAANHVSGPSGGKGPKNLTGKMNARMY